MTAARMLAEARKDLGLAGRPNRITRSYSSRNGSEFLRAAWCDMSVSEWARRSDNAGAVLPNGDRAYTVWHAEDGRNLGRWHAGTAANIKAHAKPGAVIFFDWDGTDTIGRIDHVGIVETNLGDGRVATIEGNTGDACKRRVRGADVIAGFWNPPYDKQEDDVAAKDLWQHELAVPFGSKENPEWQAGNVLVNAAKWIHEMRDRMARMDAKLDAQNATISTLVQALADRDASVDPDALIDRIRTELDNVSIELRVGK